jgi:hypothetical protein
MFQYLRETQPEKQQETQEPEKKHKIQSIDFIKEIYRVKPETGNVDYFYCNCENFPEYKPIESHVQLQYDIEEIIHSSK